MVITMKLISNVSKIKNKKTAQYNFYRNHIIPHNLEDAGNNSWTNSSDALNLYYIVMDKGGKDKVDYTPTSIMDIQQLININNPASMLKNKEDENLLFALWQDSQNEEPVLSVDDSLLDKAKNLMRRGYLIEENGRFQITDKGKKTIVEKIIVQNSDTDDSFVKTSSFKIVESNGVIDFGGQKFKAWHKTPEGDIGIILKPGQIDLLPEELRLLIRTTENDNIHAIIPRNVFEAWDNAEKNGVAPNRFPYTHVWNVQPTDAWGVNAPIQSSSNGYMKKFSSSKLLGIMKYAEDEDVKNAVQSELENRKLKIRLIAKDSKSREKGLMFQQPLSGDEAAVFVFDYPGSYPFWNKNVSFGIDVAAFDSGGELLTVESLKANQESPVLGTVSGVKYVIEAPENWFSGKNGNLWDFLENWPK